MLDLQVGVVGVDDLFQVHSALAEVNEGSIGVVILVQLMEGVLIQLGLLVDTRKNAPGEIAAHRQEVDRPGEILLQTAQGPIDLSQMLVTEGFVNTQIVVAVAKVTRFAQARSGSGRSGNGVYVYVFVQ